MAMIKPVLWRTIERKFKGFNGSKAPLIAGHKLLYKCNLECKMCPFWRRKDEELLSVEDELRMMEALKKGGVSFLGFEGVEPLLRNDIQDILAESHKRFHTSIVTNGWLLKTKLKSIENYVDYMFVSIDGIGELHDKMR
ncbi:MAG: heme d1 biosynthesis protein (NirJ-related) [Thermoplasmatales archaeon Gpl]|jgi:MoaA/NifB/PqqE/SkfB family radical SAM enzyme|nr:MAG: heme d1 biosynthesis protein (NirJ-related) [Thermoplasmatales archaeon Gpl]